MVEGGRYPPDGVPQGVIVVLLFEAPGGCLLIRRRWRLVYKIWVARRYFVATFSRAAGGGAATRRLRRSPDGLVQQLGAQRRRLRGLRWKAARFTGDHRQPPACWSTGEQQPFNRR